MKPQVGDIYKNKEPDCVARYIILEVSEEDSRHTYLFFPGRKGNAYYVSKFIFWDELMESKEIVLMEKE